MITVVLSEQIMVSSMGQLSELVMSRSVSGLIQTFLKKFKAAVNSSVWMFGVWSSFSTTNLIEHLQKHHKIESMA